MFKLWRFLKLQFCNPFCHSVCYTFREDNKIFNSGDVDGFLEGMITSVGLDAQKSASLSELHGTLLEQAQTNQSSYSDVSIDEETTYAVQYQQLYKACANMVNIYFCACMCLCVCPMKFLLNNL